MLSCIGSKEKLLIKVYVIIFTLKLVCNSLNTKLLTYVVGNMGWVKQTLYEIKVFVQNT